MNRERLIIVAVIIAVVVVVSSAFFGTQFVRQSEEPGKEPESPEGIQTNDTTGAGGEEEGGETEGVENLVEITSQGTFSPEKITISVGERVYFVNNDDEEHTVRIPSRAWEQTIEPGERSERPPKYYEAQEGSNTFELKDDPQVTGTIIVE
ncbi:MAG: cupredoxin domain-containing protein [Candidatus Aenigmatarchaeota archaeon]